MTTRLPKTYKTRRLANPDDKQKQEEARTEQLQSQYYTMRTAHKGMTDRDALATACWLDAARDLTDDFRGFKTFYPWDKYVRFLGYTNENRAQAETTLDSDLTDMAERLSRSLFPYVACGRKYSLTFTDLGTERAEKAHEARQEIPEDYRGITFSAWLDIFLEFAMCLAREGKVRESYEICEAAKDAIVYYHSREDMFLIHVAWCSKLESPASSSHLTI